MALKFHEFREKIFLRENIIVNITAYGVIFFEICVIQNMKILYFEAFHGNLVPRKFQTIQ